MNRALNIFKQIKEKKPDAILLKNAVSPYLDPSFFWVTGLERGVFETVWSSCGPMERENW